MSSRLFSVALAALVAVFVVVQPVIAHAAAGVQWADPSCCCPDPSTCPCHDHDQNHGRDHDELRKCGREGAVITPAVMPAPIVAPATIAVVPPRPVAAPEIVVALAPDRGDEPPEPPPF